MNTTKTQQKILDEILIKRNNLNALLYNDGDVKAYYTSLKNELSVRAKNVLFINNLLNVYDLLPWIEKSRKDFRGLHKCGAHTSNELLSLVSKLREFIDQKLYDDVKKEIHEMNEPHESFIIKDNNLFLKIRNCGRKTAEELKLLTEKINEYISGRHSLTISEITNNTELFENVEETDIQYVFHNLTHQLSNRAYNVMNRMGLLDLKSFILFVGTGLINQNTTFNNDISAQTILFPNCWMYSEQEKDFISYYESKNGHYPMFFLLQYYFLHTENKSEKLFSHFFSFNDEEPILLNKASELFSISKERIRQRINSVINNPSRPLKTLLHSKEWKYYDILKHPFLFEEDCSDVIDTEHIPNPLNLLVLLKCFGWRLYFLDLADFMVNDYMKSACVVPIALNKKYASFRLKKVLREIHRLNSIRANHIIRISIVQYFIENEDYWDHPISLTVRDKTVISSMLTRMCDNLVEIKKGSIIIEAKKYNYQDAVYSILKESGKRLSTEEISQQLINKCQSSGFVCKFNNPAQIKRFLMTDGRIIAIGKSSFWGLKEWGEVAFSIKDIAISVLSQSPIPMKIDQLAKESYKFRPDSSIKSICSIIRQCTYSGDMILFFGDYVGMPSLTYSSCYVKFPQSFNEWLLSFKEYVIKNKRFPSSNQNGFEGFLYRWYYKAKQMVNLSADEILKIESLDKELSYYPHNSKEYIFLENCNLYQRFVEQNKRLINLEDDKTLYYWFHSAKKSLNSLADNRKLYFQELLKNLSAILY